MVSVSYPEEGLQCASGLVFGISYGNQKGPGEMDISLYKVVSRLVKDMIQVCDFFLGNLPRDTLPETNIAPRNGW